jgi:hypothetical protein
MLEVVKTVNTKLEEKGLNPKDFSSTAAFVRMLTADKQGANMIMTAEEVRTAMEDAFAKVELRDPDHLYVPGRVVHMYDLWNKQDSEKAKNSAKEGADQVAVAEVRPVERLYIGDGASNLLRYIEMDSRMMTDHLAPGYRSSIKTLLSTQAP